MFLFNHRLLHTSVRAARYEARNSPTCELCGTEEETDIHVFIGCQEKQLLASWLHCKLKKLGCSADPGSYIRGDIGKRCDPKEAVPLIASFVHTIWRGRGLNLVPTTKEILQDLSKFKKS